MRERPEDGPEVEWLLDLTFAPGRTALSSYRLRDGVDPIGELCTVARDDYDVLAGCIRVWPVRLGDTNLPGLLLGPVAVHPTRQGEGLGALLIATTLQLATTEGWTRVVLVGDEPYYSRFGFTRDAASGLAMPSPTNPDRVLGLELLPGSMRNLTGNVSKWVGLTSR